MSLIYVTFGGLAFDSTTAIQRAREEEGEVDRHIVYDDRWLVDSGFKARHQWLWDAKPQHGFGHCSWKPFIILDAISKAKQGDIVLYTDADTYPIADMSPFFEMCERDGMVLFEEQGCINRNWIKRDCFIEMGADHPSYWDAKHACGRFQLFKVGGHAGVSRITCSSFVGLWAEFSVNRRCQLHDTGDAPNMEGFTRHSTEQAVLTLLAHKYGIPLHRTPDQNGWPISPNCGQPGDDYPQIFKQEWCEGDRTNLSGSRFRNV